MAFPSGTQWEIAPDGSAGQSGAFASSYGGTDLSRSITAAAVVNDAVSNSTTTITSASAPFLATMVGNGVILQGDGEYLIVSVVSSSNITVDRATGAGSGQTLRVGGATTMTNSAPLFQPGFRGTLAAGHKMWIRGTNSAGVATVYSMTPSGQPAFPVDGTAVNPITTEGYSTTRGDGGRPVIALPGWALNLFVSRNIIKNLEIRTGGAGGIVATLRI